MKTVCQATQLVLLLLSGFASIFARLFARMFARLFARMFVQEFVRLFARMSVQEFVRMCVDAEGAETDSTARIGPWCIHTAPRSNTESNL